MSTPRDLFPHLYPPSDKPKAKSNGSSDASSLKSSKTIVASPLRDLWCNTQWANLSMQAKQINLPLLPYFDTKTMLLSKEVNVRLWKQLEKLFNSLGPEKAPFATPVLTNGVIPEIKWHSYLEGDKGDDVEVYDK